LVCLTADLYPEFGSKFGAVSGRVGENVSISVTFSGKPKKVQWFHKGVEVSNDGRYSVSVTTENEIV